MKNLQIILAALIILTAVNCKKDKKEDKNPQPDGQALENMFQDNRANDMQTFQVDASAGGTITGAEGTKITFDPNSFAINGTPVTGNVDIQLIEVYDRANMVMKSMPTTGKRPNGDEETLKSGGELFIKAKQGNNELELLNPMHIESGYDPDGSFNNPMQVFRAGDNVNDNEKWEEKDEDQNGHADFADTREVQDVNGNWHIIYGFDTSEFGWTNLDRWFTYTGTLTTLNVGVPDGYTDDNCALFVIYDGEPKALARLDRYDASTGLFTEHFGKLPVGIDIHILMITSIDDVLHYSLIGTTSVANGTNETMPDPQPTTESDLIAIINGLP